MDRNSELVPGNSSPEIARGKGLYMLQVWFLGKFQYYGSVCHMSG